MFGCTGGVSQRKRVNMSQHRLRLEPLEQRQMLSVTPMMIRDINPGASNSLTNSFEELNGSVFLPATDGISGSEVWKTDGTSAGTVLVKDINPGANQAFPANLKNVNGTLYFSAVDGTHGRELWRTDGTSAGTVLVKDINPGSGGSGLSNFTEVNGTLFFAADDGTNGIELWKSDGTSSGTTLVADISPSSGYFVPSPSNLINVNGILYFTHDNGTNGTELWKSDGTSGGTMLVADIRPGSSGSTPTRFAIANGTLFFSANDGTNGTELWKSDGTSSGTTLIADINPGSGNSFPYLPTNVNGTLYFQADNGTNGQELWKSNGTSIGTVLVRDINPGSAHGLDTPYFTNVNGTIYFRATDGVNGRELWSSDGTSAGTAIVNDIVPGSGSSFVGKLINLNGTLFFVAVTPATSSELWSSNGTSTGTALVQDIQPGTSSSSLSYFKNVNGVLFFGANDGTHGLEPWKLDPNLVVPNTTLSIDNSSLAENGGIATVTATLDATSSQAVTVNLGFTGTATLNTDYAASSTSITIPAGSLTGSVTLTGVTDTTFEGNESVVVDITSVTGATENGSQQVTATITDDDSQPSVSLIVANSPLAENGGVATVTARLSNPSTQDVTVNLAFTGSATLNSDYSASSNSVLILAGQTSGSIMLTGIDDGLSEGGETILVDITSVANGTENGTQQVTATITDDEPPPANVSLSRFFLPVGENGGTSTVTATLDSTSSVNVVVNLGFSGTAGGAEYSASSNSILILAGQSSGSITLTGINDALSERTETILVDIVSVTGAIENGSQQISVPLVDDDRYVLNGPTLTINGVPGADALILVRTSATGFYTFYDTEAFAYTVPAVSNVVLNSGGGGNVVQIFGAAGITESATVGANTLNYSGAGLTAQTSGTPTVYVFGQTEDTANFVDSVGNDNFYGLDSVSILLPASGSSFFSVAGGFGTVTADSGSGVDFALLFGSPGDDTLTSSGAGANVTTTLVVTGISITQSRFDNVYVFGQGGNDTGALTGTPGDDTLYGLPAYSVFTGPNMYIQAIAFPQLTVNAGTGNDLAYLYDSAGNDTFTGAPTSSSLSGTGYNNIANGFDTVYGFASTGNDSAIYDGGAGDDLFYGLVTHSLMQAIGQYLTEAIGFDLSHANIQTQGGNDTALLYDSAGNDTLISSGNQAELSYGGSGVINRASAFDAVFAYQSTGSDNETQTPPLSFNLTLVGTWF